MKKFFTVATCIIIALLSVITVCAVNDTYFVSELNINISVPSYYNVFTRDMEEDSFELKKFGYTKEDLTEMLVEGDIYFNAFPDNLSEEIVLTATDVNISDISIFTDGEIEELATDSIASFEADGTKVADYNIYTNSDTTYIATTIEVPEYGNAINYYTINDYKAINVTCWTYENELTDSKLQLFASILDSITYNAYAESNGTTTLPQTETTTPLFTEYADISDLVSEEDVATIGIAVIVVIASVVLTLIAGGVVAIILVTKAKKRRRAAQFTATQQATADVKYCIHCGTQIAAADAFCFNCGKSQVTETETTENIE